MKHIGFILVYALYRQLGYGEAACPHWSEKPITIVQKTLLAITVKNI